MLEPGDGDGVFVHEIWLPDAAPQRELMAALPAADVASVMTDGTLKVVCVGLLRVENGRVRERGRAGVAARARIHAQRRVHDDARDRADEEKREGDDDFVRCQPLDDARN